MNGVYSLKYLHHFDVFYTYGAQWRLVGFIVEEANLNRHSNNKYTIIIIFLNILYRVPQNSRNSLPVRC
jgi:hypothetical protein